jgi:exopolysaccharide biosynthesis protein
MENKMNQASIQSIYKKLKDVLVKDTSIQDLTKDIESTAYEYAYQSTKDIPRLVTYEDIKRHKEDYDEVFMNHYLKALKVLKNTVIL